MKNRSRSADYIPGVSSLSGGLISAALTTVALGLAVWSLQSAKWLNPNPPFVLVLILGLGLSTTLALTRFRQLMALLICILAGVPVAIWQSARGLPEAGGLNFWSQWFGALAKPASDPTTFIVLLVIITWLTGVLGAWYAVRRRNGWVAFVLGCLLAVLNLINLPRDFNYILPLILAFSLALIVQTNWLKARSKIAAKGRVSQFVPGLAICVIVVVGAFALPLSPADKLSLDIDGGAIYSAIKNNGFNIFQAVPSKVKTILSSNQETVNFGVAPDLGDTVRFKVSPAMTGYFATRYYDTYSAGGWSSSPLTDATLAANQAVGEAIPPLKATTVHYKVETDVKTDIILINGRPTSIDISTIAGSLPAPTGADISSLVSARMLSAYSSYSVISQISVATVADLLKANNSYPDWISARYLQLPATLPRSVKTLAQQLTRGIPSSTTGTDTYNKVVAIENYLQNFKYDIDGSFISGNTDGVASFLADRQGNCVNFASTLVVMLRSIGVPARFVQGYLGSEIDNDALSIYGRDAHAWAEVYFPDYGWIIAEATPGKPADNFSTFSSQFPAGTLPPGTEITPITGDNPEQSLTPPGSLPSDPGVNFQFTWILWGLLAGLVLTAGGGMLYITRAYDPGAMYSRLAWLGRLYGEPLLSTDTPWEYSKRLGRKLNVEAPGISAIAHAFARSRYGLSNSADIADRGELAYMWKNLSLQLIKRRLGLKKSE